MWPSGTLIREEVGLNKKKKINNWDFFIAGVDLSFEEGYSGWMSLERRKDWCVFSEINM